MMGVATREPTDLLADLHIGPFSHDEERGDVVRWMVPLAAEGWRMVVDIGTDDRAEHDPAEPWPADGYAWVGVRVFDPADVDRGMASLFGIDVEAYCSPDGYLWTLVGELIEEACQEAGVAPNRGEVEE